MIAHVSTNLTWESYKGDTHMEVACIDIQITLAHYVLPHLMQWEEFKKSRMGRIRDWKRDLLFSHLGYPLRVSCQLIEWMDVLQVEGYIHVLKVTILVISCVSLSCIMRFETQHIILFVIATMDQEVVAFRFATSLIFFYRERELRWGSHGLHGII